MNFTSQMRYNPSIPKMEKSLKVMAYICMKAFSRL